MVREQTIAALEEPNWQKWNLKKHCYLTPLALGKPQTSIPPFAGRCDRVSNEHTSLAKYFGFHGVVRATRCLSSARCLSSRRCLCSVAASMLPSFRELVTCCQRCLRDGEGAQATEWERLCHGRAPSWAAVRRGAGLGHVPRATFASRRACEPSLYWDGDSSHSWTTSSDLLNSPYSAMPVNFLNSFCSCSWLFTSFFSKQMDFFQSFPIHILYWWSTPKWPVFILCLFTVRFLNYNGMLSRSQEFIKSGHWLFPPGY